MLYYALVLLTVGLITGVLNYTGMSSLAVEIPLVLSLIGIVLVATYLFNGRIGHHEPHGNVRRCTMVREKVSNPTTPGSASISRVDQQDEQSGPPFQISKAGWDYERIARRAYELYLQRGQQGGRDLEDWVKAEQQLAGEAGK
jgi:uncharacterized membrane protein YtjA (UPF0391 family)